MYTMQKLGDATDEHGNLKPFYGMVVYQRMTDNELVETKKAYDYDANIDFTDAVPNDCKFRVSASYNNPDDFEENTNGSVTLLAYLKNLIKTLFYSQDFTLFLI